MVLMGFVGLWPERGAEVVTGCIVHMLQEQALGVRDYRRLSGDRRR